MNGTFEKRVRAAAVAGWWVVLIAVGLAILQVAACLFVMNTRPLWIQTMWGPDITWAVVQIVLFWLTAIFRLVVLLLVLVVLWLTLWARELRKRMDAA